MLVKYSRNSILDYCGTPYPASFFLGIVKLELDLVRGIKAAFSGVDHSNLF